MGFFDSLFGQGGADAAREASNLQYKNQSGAAGYLQDQGKAYAGNFADLAKGFDPYVQGGGKAQNQVYNLLGLNGQPQQSEAFGQFQSDPGYQYQLDQGINAVDRSAAARGMTNSGATLKALQKTGQGLADQSYNSYLQRLMGLGQQGQSATAQQVGTVGTGLTGQLNADTQSANMMYGAANTIPQGIIAAQNSQDKGAQNAIDLGTKAIGMLMGAPSGGGGGSSFSSMMSAGASPQDAFSQLMQGGGYYGGSPSSNPNLRPF